MELPLEDDAASMHSTPSVSEMSDQRTVPQFLVKLFKMTNNEAHQHVVQWSGDGTSFWVADIASFSRDILPYYFKHNNYASFVRQLNMYGFHRSTNTKGKAMPGIEMIERFSNQYFRRGREDLLIHIRRKASTSSKKKPSISTSQYMPPHEPVAAVLQPTVSQMIESRLLALERQVQFLHLQNQALAQQSVRQQEALQHCMRVFARMGVTPEGDLPQHLGGQLPGSHWPQTHLPNMATANFGGFGSTFSSQPLGQMHMPARSLHQDRDIAVLVDDDGMDIDAMLASMDQTQRDGFVSVS